MLPADSPLPACSSARVPHHGSNKLLAYQQGERVRGLGLGRVAERLSSLQCEANWDRSLSGNDFGAVPGAANENPGGKELIKARLAAVFEAAHEGTPK